VVNEKRAFSVRSLSRLIRKNCRRERYSSKGEEGGRLYGNEEECPKAKKGALGLLGGKTFWSRNYSCQEMRITWFKREKRTWGSEDEFFGRTPAYGRPTKT